jgi:phospholipid/cholesterol/gamma-HCH transport system permease protein
MMLIRYITQIGKILDATRNFQTNKWSVMKKLIFKEIDDLIIESLV